MKQVQLSIFDMHFRLKYSELEKRLDPAYYLPELRELERKVISNTPNRLRDFIIKMSSGATPSIGESDKYYTDASNGIPFIRVQNLSETNELKLDDTKFITKETHNTYLKRSKVSEGDLLVKITGVGRMAVSSVAPKDFDGNINQHIVVIKTASAETSYALAAYLNTDVGEKLASRRATGGTRPALDYPALRSIPVLKDERLVKIFREAALRKKQKEEEAKELLKSVDEYLLSELGINIPENDNSLENRIFASNFSCLSSNRWDPKAYSTFYKNLLSAINKSSFHISPLRNFVIDIKSGLWGYDENSLSDKSKFVKCLVIRSTEFDNNYNLKIDNNRTKYRYIRKDKLADLDIREYDLLIERSGGSPDQPVGRTALIEQGLLSKKQICFSNFISKIRINQSELVPSYTFYYLKTMHRIKLTEVMQSQTHGIRNLIWREFLNLPISKPSLELQERIVHHLDEISIKALQLEKEALEIIDKAKKEAEKIILGNS